MFSCSEFRLDRNSEDVVITCSRKVFSLSGTSSAVVLLTSTMEQQGTVSRGFDDYGGKYNQ